MEYRAFGRTGLEVPAIGFGCWEVGGGYGQVEEAEFARAVAEVENNAGALGWSIAAADRAEIDAILARHGVNTAPDYWIEAE